MAALLPRSKRHAQSTLDGSVPVERFLHANAASAVAALNRVGAEHIPSLDLSLQHERMGSGRRLFGIVQDPRTYGQPTDRRVRELLQSSLKPTKTRTRNRYLVCSTRLAKNLMGRLHVLGVHLPWDWKPGNYDLTLRLARLDREHRWGFQRYFSQTITFFDTADPRRHKVLPGDLRSLGLSPHSEDNEPAPGGLVLEVNVR